MGATVYGVPEGFDPPDWAEFKDDDGRFSFEKMQEIEGAWLERLRIWVMAHGQGALRGQLIHFPVADGAAQYMIFKHQPFQLLHIPLGDAWHVSDITLRGLRISDAREMIDRNNRIAELFGHSR